MFLCRFHKNTPQKDHFPAVSSARSNDQSKERINLPGVTLFDLCRISNRSGGKEGVPPRQFDSRSSVASYVVFEQDVMMLSERNHDLLDSTDSSDHLRASLLSARLSGLTSFVTRHSPAKRPSKPSHPP